MPHSNKKPIGWHEECLRNFSEYLTRKQKQLEDLQSEVNKMILEEKFRQFQIHTAKERNLDGFDEDRFLKREREQMLEKYKNVNMGNLILRNG